MSQVIDTKVVEMQFDNSKFEKNIQTSLNSLKFLNKNIDEAGKNRGSLDNLAKAGDQVGLAFDNMNMKSKISLNMMDMLAGVGTKAFNRISDAVAGFALNMANSLSGMQAMRDGFNEYELKMGSVQTMLVGAKIIDPKTSKATEDETRRLEIINDELEKLNEYSDKTIYSFKDMTSNIGKFTNNGVELHDAVDAIQGVANVAAAAGANSQEASRAMYNFSQALSSGAVKLIDWKSIENANMATQGFKQQLLDTALVFGTVTKKGKEYKTATTDLQGKISDAFTTTKGFNDSLSHQWMTTEVLTQTLKNYSTDVRYMSDTALEEYRKSLIKLGYTSKQVDRIIETSRKAFEAATEVKTFSQMIDTLKESLGSGWAQTWEIVIGDFREAKALFTGLEGAIESILSPIGEARNAILKMWKKDGGRQALINSFVNLFYAVKNLLEPIKQLWIAFTPNTSHIGKGLATISKWIENITAVVRRGAIVVGKVLAGLLRPVIFIGNLVGKGLIKLVGIIRTTFAKIVNFFKPVGKAVTDFGNTLNDIFSKHIISRLKAFQTTVSKAFNNLKTRVKSSAALMKLIEAFKNLRSIVSDLFGRVTQKASLYAREFATYLGKVWTAVEPLVSSTVTKVIKRLADFLIPKLNKALTFAADRIKAFGRALGSINLRNTKLYKFFSDLPEKIKALANNKTIKSISSTIKNFGKEAVGFLDKKFKSFKTTVDSIKMPGGLKDLFENVKNFIKSIFGKGSVSDGLTENLEKITEATDKIASEGTEGKLTLFQKFLEGIRDAFEWVKNAANDAKDAISKFINFVKTNTPKALKSIHDFLAGDDGILTFSDLSHVIYDAADAWSMILSAFGMKEMGDAAKGISNAFGDLTESITTLLKRTSNSMKMSAVKDFAIAIGILVGAMFLLSRIPADKLAIAIGALVIVGAGLAKFFDHISNASMKLKDTAGTLIPMAVLAVALSASLIGVGIALGMLVGALALFPKVIKSYNNLGDEFKTGMKRVKEVLAEIFEYLDHSANAKYGFRSAAALLALVTSLTSIRNTIINFAKEETGEAMKTGLARIKQVLDVLGDFLASVQLGSFGFINVGIDLDTVGMAAVIFALGNLMKKIVGPIKELSKLTPTEFETAFKSIRKILEDIGIFLIAVSNLSSLTTKNGLLSKGGLGQFLGIAAVVGILGSTISTIVGSLKTLTALAGDEAAFSTATKALRNIFIELGGILVVIGLLKPDKAVGILWSLGGTIAILTACVMALVPIAKTNPGALVSSVLALGVLMLAFGGALKITGDAANQTAMKDIVKIVVMALAMVALANVIRRLARVGDPKGMIAASAAISVAAVALAGALYILGKAPAINPTVLIGLALLTAAIWGIVFAIRAFKGSANDMSSASDTVKSSVDKTVNETGTALEEGMSSRLKMIDLSGIIGPMMEKIGEKIKNFDLGAYLRQTFEKIKADAVHWAQDFLDIGSNIISGLSAALSNPANIDRIKEDMKALGKALLDAFKSFLGIHSPSTVMKEQGGYVIDGLVQGLMQYPEKLAQWVTGIGTFIMNGVSGFFGGALEKGKALVEGIGQGIQNGKDFVVKKASEVGSTAIKGVGKVKDWAKQATASANAYGHKLANSKNPIKRAAGSMIIGATNTIKGVSKTFGTFASSASKKFSAEIKAGSSPAKAAGKALLAGAKAAFNNIKSSFRTFGENAAQGFKNGINSLISSVAEKAREMVRKAKNAAKSEQNSNSPSKDFMEYGGWAAQGYAIGMTNRKNSLLIEDSARKMVGLAKGIAMGADFGSASWSLDSNPAMSSLAYAMAQISDTVDSNIDANPTIRPVIDMSNVNRNTSAISALFNDKKLQASLDATGQIQSDLDRKLAIQNGASSMKSIDKLANKLETMNELMNSRSMTNYITVDGSEDPMLFVDMLVREMRLKARSV